MKLSKRLIISGINMDEGGILSILNDLLTELNNSKYDDYNVIVLVKSRDLFTQRRFHYVEFPRSKKSWFFRIYYEYFKFYQISKKLRPDVWLSMHDVTPNVSCRNLYVYCHNVTPFYRPNITDWRFGTRASLFSYIYSIIYLVNKNSSKGVIVQQDWIRKKFREKYNRKNIIVAHPNLPESHIESTQNNKRGYGNKSFFYPSFPRTFKNFKIIFESIRLMDNEIRKKITVYITIDEGLNRYAKCLKKKYTDVPEVKFLGLMSREEVHSYYAKVDALLFPSKLESWGLPISEFKAYNKPMILADLPYSRETVGNYDKVVFFDADSTVQLSQYLEFFVLGHLDYSQNKESEIDSPYFRNWENLLDHILKQ